MTGHIHTYRSIELRLCKGKLNFNLGAGSKLFVHTFSDVPRYTSKEDLVRVDGVLVVARGKLPTPRVCRLVGF